MEREKVFDQERSAGRVSKLRYDVLEVIEVPRQRESNWKEQELELRKMQYAECLAASTVRIHYQSASVHKSVIFS
jgi:hypothetical protein